MVIRSSVTAVCVALVFSFGVRQLNMRVAHAAEQGAAAQPSPDAQQPAMQDMMRLHQQMMAEMKAGNAKLDALVKDMNAAAGDARIAAIAVVVNELVRQHQAMHHRMGEMHHQHMMGSHGGMMRR
jgi:hypothetical protein